MPSSVSGHRNVLPIIALFSTVQPIPPATTEIPHIVQRAFDLNMFPFATPAIIDPGAPSALRRSHRRRMPSIQKPKHLSHNVTKNNAGPPLKNTLPAKTEPGTTNLDSVLDAGGRHGQLTPTSSSTHLGRRACLTLGGRDRVRGLRNLSWTAPLTYLPTSPPCERSYNHCIGRVRSQFLSANLVTK